MSTNPKNISSSHNKLNRRFLIIKLWVRSFQPHLMVFMMMQLENLYDDDVELSVLSCNSFLIMKAVKYSWKVQKKPVSWSLVTTDH